MARPRSPASTPAGSRGTRSQGPPTLPPAPPTPPLERRHRRACAAPAGPKTIHFWAPTFKWAITFSNISDFERPTEQISLPHQAAVAATGSIWVRYSTQINPVNYNLLTVNVFMAATGLYQIYRKVTAEGLGAPQLAAA